MPLVLPDLGGDTQLDKAESVLLVEGGPLRATIRVTRSWQSSKFVQDIVLYSTERFSGQPRATIAGRMQSSKFRQFAGLIWVTASMDSA